MQQSDDKQPDKAPVKLKLSRASDPSPFSPLTPAGLALHYGYYHYFRILQDKGKVDLLALDRNGSTLVHQAVVFNKPAALTTLSQDTKVDLTILNRHGLSALDLALITGERKECAEALRTLGMSSSAAHNHQQEAVYLREESSGLYLNTQRGGSSGQGSVGETAQPLFITALSRDSEYVTITGRVETPLCSAVPLCFPLNHPDHNPAGKMEVNQLDMWGLTVLDNSHPTTQRVCLKHPTEEKWLAGDSSNNGLMWLPMLVTWALERIPVTTVLLPPLSIRSISSLAQVNP